DAPGVVVAQDLHLAVDVCATDLRLALAEGDAAIDRAEPNRIHALGPEIGHGMLDPLAAVRHEHGIHRLGVGVAALAAALRGDLAHGKPECLAKLAEFRVPAMHDHHRLIERGDILREPRVHIGADPRAASDFDHKHETFCLFRAYAPDTRSGGTDVLAYRRTSQPRPVSGAMERRAFRPPPVREAIGQIGCRPGNSSPVFSGKPIRMFIDCTACPEAPFIRLSSAAMTTTRFECSSRSKPTSHQFDPLRSFGSG